MNIWTSEV